MYRDDAHCRTVETNATLESDYAPARKKQAAGTGPEHQQAASLPSSPTAEEKHRSATPNRLLRKYCEVLSLREHPSTRPMCNEYLSEMMLGKMT